METKHRRDHLIYVLRNMYLYGGLCWRVSTSIDRVPCRVVVLVVIVHVHPVVGVQLVATDGGDGIGKLAQNCPNFCLLPVDAKY